MSARVHFVFGDDYLAVAKAKALLDANGVSPTDPLSSEIIDGQVDTIDEAIQAIGLVREALATRGFFGGRKVVWFRGVSFLIDGPIGRSDRVKPVLGRLGDMLKAGLDDTVVLVLSAPRVDKRLAFCKLLSEVAEVHEFAAPEKQGQNRQHAASVLDAGLKQVGLTMHPDVREAFLERVGADTRTVLNELAKMATYLGKRRVVTAADIEAVTSMARDALAWDIQDAFGRRELGHALAVLRRLLFQRESAMAIMALLESRIRDLVVYREALDRGWLSTTRSGAGTWGKLPAAAEHLLTAGLGRDYRAVHPYRLSRLVEQAQSFSGRELQRALTLALAAHRQLVTSSLPPPSSWNSSSFKSLRANALPPLAPERRMLILDLPARIAQTSRFVFRPT